MGAIRKWQGEVAGVGNKAFRTRLSVPKRCQEIRQIKIDHVNQPFFTVFWVSASNIDVAIIAGTLLVYTTPCFEALAISV